MTENIVKISQIIDARRLDPIFFRTGYVIFKDKFPLAPLKSFCLYFQSGFGAGKGDQTTEENGIIQIRPTNIDNEGILKYDRNVYVPATSNKPMLEYDDVLFNNTNSQELVGKTAILKENKKLFFSNHITQIKVDKSKANPDYLWIVLNIYQKKNIFYSICTNWNNQSGVGIELLKSIQVPLPPLKTQQEIVNIYNKANQAKKNKEQEAQPLLDSIDNYLLRELGIELPTKTSSVENKYFNRKINFFFGKRYDPYYHQPFFEHAFSAIEKTLFEKKFLGKITTIITSGITPLSGGDAYISSQKGIPFVRSGDININGDINFEELLYLKPEIHNGKMKSSRLQKNDILIAIVGATIGQVGVYKYDREANINQAIALVRLQDGINYEYVKEFIKSPIGQLNLDRLKRPVARANINLEEIASIRVVLPPLEKQNEIANGIQTIRVKAQQLQTEASLLLAEAKKEIEKIILG